MVKMAVFNVLKSPILISRKFFSVSKLSQIKLATLAKILTKCIKSKKLLGISREDLLLFYENFLSSQAKFFFFIFTKNNLELGFFNEKQNCTLSLK